MPALVAERTSDRKRRLFAVACLRRFAAALADPRSRRAVEVAERYAQGLASEGERQAAEDDAFEAHDDYRRARFDSEVPFRWTWQDEQLTRATGLVVSHGLYYAEDVADYARRALAGLGEGWPGEAAEEAIQCRVLEEILGPKVLPAIDPAWLAFQDAAVVQVARCVAASGEPLDRLVLADALEEAGCEEAALLGHLREPWGHVPGCWAVDLILG